MMQTKTCKITYHFNSKYDNRAGKNKNLLTLDLQNHRHHQQWRKLQNRMQRTANNKQMSDRHGNAGKKERRNSSTAINKTRGRAHHLQQWKKQNCRQQTMMMMMRTAVAPPE